MRTIAIVQARMGSTRLPGKVLLPLGGKPVLQWVIERVREAIPDVVIATTEEEADNPIAYLGWELETPVVRYGTGEAANDVLTRFRRVLEQFPCDVFVRVTADCPLFEPEMAKATIRQMSRPLYPGHPEPRCIDYCDGGCGQGFADGLDCEGVRTPVFMNLKPHLLTKEEREHVTLFSKHDPRSLRMSLALAAVSDYRRNPKRYRLTLDTLRDYERLQRIWAEVPHGPHGPDTLKALQWLEQHPEWWGDA